MAFESPGHPSIIATLLNPPLCANTKGKQGTKEHQPCQNVAKQVCSPCRLVQYCSKECQIEDRPHHKKICKSDLMNPEYAPGWFKQRRTPDWMSASGPPLVAFGLSQYLWGNVPALDLLNMRQNEGIYDLRHEIHMLFAASGDMRNVVKSVADGLPDDFVGQCTVVLNDFNFTIVARNAIMLLVALSLQHDEAVVIMLHLWYSALLPQELLRTLQDTVLRPILAICDKIENKPLDSFQAKTFFFHRRSLRLTLKKREWDELKTFFNVPKNLTAEDAQNDPSRMHSPHERVATTTFRQNGLLLPHGTSRQCFDVPNPTFLNEKRIWPMKDDADPLAGWDEKEYTKFVPLARDDVMGGFSFFLRDMFSRFHKRISKAGIHFHLLCVDARNISSYLSSTNAKFDRIEVSNICDRGYLGLEIVLSTFGPLLKPKQLNPKATLLLLFINAVYEEMQFQPPIVQAQRQKQSMALMKRFLYPTLTMMTNMFAGDFEAIPNPDLVKIMGALSLFGDFDQTFEPLLREIHQLASKHGMKVKDKHSIIEPWPLRVTGRSTKKEFEIRLASSHTGHERYVELEKLA